MADVKEKTESNEEYNEDNYEGKKYSSSDWKNFYQRARERHNYFYRKNDLSEAETSECKRNKDDNEYKKYEDKFKEAMRSYAEQHKRELNNSLFLYKRTQHEYFGDNDYCSVPVKDLKAILAECKIMIMTANPIERAVLHSLMLKQDNSRIIKVIYECTDFYIFKWNSYWVAHLHQSDIGANRNWGTGRTIYEALKHFTPNVIISLGVAFGIDYEVQKLGDVIVSKRLLPYSENKRDKDKIKPDRNQDKRIEQWLHVRMDRVAGFFNNVTYGDILTGGSVMSSAEEKDIVCLGYTESDYIVGGEMEGDALFRCTDMTDIPGVVIKGICDWGVAKNDIFDGNPQKEEWFKDSLQAYAMTKAVEKCNLLLRDKNLFAVPKNAECKETERKMKRFKSILNIMQCSIVVFWLVIFVIELITHGSSDFGVIASVFLGIVLMCHIIFKAKESVLLIKSKVRVKKLLKK